MTRSRLGIGAAFVSAVLSVSVPAWAQNYAFTYTGTAGSGISGSGTITTGSSNPPGSFFTPSLLVTSITGVFDGNAITGLLPSGTFYKTSGIFGSPGNDNIIYYPSSQTFMGQTTYIDRYGLGFATGTQNIDLFFGAGGYGSILQSTGASAVTSDVGGRFTISAIAAPAPEPATWAMMILGFGLVGFAMRRRKSAIIAKVSYAR